MTPSDAKRILMQEFGLDASITAQATPADVLLYIRDRDTRFAVVDNAATHRIAQYESTAGWWLADDRCNTATIFTTDYERSLEHAETPCAT